MGLTGGMSKRWGRRRSARTRTALFVVAVNVVALAVLAPLVAGTSFQVAAAASEPGMPLVVEGDVVSTYASDPSGVHVDPWVVWVCKLDAGGPVPERVAITPDDVIAVLQAHIAPYFEWLSRGAYQPTYAPGGSIPAGTNDPDTAMSTCVTNAVASPVSAGFAGAMVMLDAPVETGVGSSGHQNCASPPCVGSTTLPGNNRTIQLGAHDLFTTTTVGTPWFAETAHEFGHTIDWGHAGPAPNYRVHEPLQPGYVPTPADAPWLDEIDPALIASFDTVLAGMGLPSIESDRATLGSTSVDCTTILVAPKSTPGWSLCVLLLGLPYGGLYDVMGTDPSPLTPDTLAIPQTQVFNRYAAGWLENDEVETYAGSYAEYDLAPIDVDGTQMLVLPSADPRQYVTIEARSSTEFLPGDDNAGVLIHVVDQRPGACGSAICWGDTDWKTMVHDGSPWARDQLLEPGADTMVNATAVSVVSANADGTYTIRVGQPPGPGPGPTPLPSPVVPATPVVRVPTFTG